MNKVKKRRRVLESTQEILEMLRCWAWWQEDINDHDWRLLDERIVRERENVDIRLDEVSNLD